MFGERAVQLIHNHSASTQGGKGTGTGVSTPRPFFLYYAFHTSCVGFVGARTKHKDSPITGDGLQPDPEYVQMHTDPPPPT